MANATGKMGVEGVKIAKGKMWSNVIHVLGIYYMLLIQTFLTFNSLGMKIYKQTDRSSEVEIFHRIFWDDIMQNLRKILLEVGLVDGDDVLTSCPLMNHLAIYCLQLGKYDFYPNSPSGYG